MVFLLRIDILYRSSNRHNPKLNASEVAHQIGKEYVEADAFPLEDTVVTRLAYDVLGMHHERLYDDLPVPVHWTEDDPYDRTDEMFQRIDQDEELWVFSGG